MRAEFSGVIYAKLIQIMGIICRNHPTGSDVEV
jgi:hypothetical protein